MNGGENFTIHIIVTIFQHGAAGHMPAFRDMEDLSAFVVNLQEDDLELFITSETQRFIFAIVWSGFIGTNIPKSIAATCRSAAT